MSEAAIPHDADPAARCENCRAPLQGAFCHRCGQSVHNPLSIAAGVMFVARLAQA